MIPAVSRLADGQETAGYKMADVITAFCSSLGNRV